MLRTFRKHWNLTRSSLKGISQRNPNTLHPLKHTPPPHPVPTAQTYFKPQNPKLPLFLSLLKNLNKLPPYVSKGAPRERGQNEYTADRTQTLTSSNIVSSALWFSPYAHLARAEHSLTARQHLTGDSLSSCATCCSVSVMRRWMEDALFAITSDVRCQRSACVSPDFQLIRRP